MRKIILAAAAAGAALTLNGCSGGSEDAGDANAQGAELQADATNATAEADAAESVGVIDANSATADQLAGAGVTPEVAQAIVGARPYATVVDLNAKLRQTLSEEAAAAVLEKVFVPVNLNTGGREEIKLIPGMTDRMVGEFLEYRPYEDMNEFNREIGKYVDDTEVARFGRYVTL